VADPIYVAQRRMRGMMARLEKAQEAAAVAAAGRHLVFAAAWHRFTARLPVIRTRVRVCASGEVLALLAHDAKPKKKKGGEEEEESPGEERRRQREDQASARDAGMLAELCRKVITYTLKGDAHTMVIRALSTEFLEVREEVRAEQAAREEQPVEDAASAHVDGEEMVVVRTLFGARVLRPKVALGEVLQGIKAKPEASSQPTSPTHSASPSERGALLSRLITCPTEDRGSQLSTDPAAPLLSAPVRKSVGLWIDRAVSADK